MWAVILFLCNSPCFFCKSAVTVDCIWSVHVQNTCAFGPGQLEKIKQFQNVCARMLQNWCQGSPSLIFSFFIKKKKRLCFFTYSRIGLHSRYTTPHFLNFSPDNAETVCTEVYCIDSPAYPILFLSCLFPFFSWFSSSYFPPSIVSTSCITQDTFPEFLI